MGQSGIEVRRSGNAIARSALLACLAFLLLLASAPPAQATTRPQVGSPITGVGTTGVTLHYPYGIGVDESTGNVFVVDGASGGGNYVAVYGAEGGIPTGVASPYKISSSFSFLQEPTQAAFDNVATSPSKGALYVTDPGRNKVKKFVRNPATQLYELSGELKPADGSTMAETIGAAIDSEGNVYAVKWDTGKIVKFSPTGTELAKFSIGSQANLALDAAGSLFSVGFHGSNGQAGGQARKFPADGLGGFGAEIKIPIEKGPNPANDGIAVDMARNQVFIGLTDRVIQVNATTLAKEGEFGVGVLEKATGIAVNSKTNRVYVSDIGTTKRVVVFGAEVPTPIATANAASSVTPTAATLNGTVNPTGTTVTECKFEYIDHDNFLKNGNGIEGKLDGPNPPTVLPCQGALPADSSDHPVTAPLTGLSPNTTYHFRVKAASANGPYTSREMTFATLGPATTEAATEVKGTKAKLNGTVNPFGLAVSECKFEYLTEKEFGENGNKYTGPKTPATAPCSGAIPSDESPHPVSAAISGLAPNDAEYHFRIVATVGGTETTGADETFSTATTVKTEPATGVAGTQATLNGLVEPEGTTVTECLFEYGTSSSYGSTAPCSDAIPADEGAHPVSAAISGLTPNGTYHFRISVTINGGVVRGGDEVFVALVQQHLLTVNKAGTGTGKVTSSPAGIDCGSDCEETYEGGAEVTLEAQADPGSQFKGWSGACSGTGACEVTMSEAREVTATFDEEASEPGIPLTVALEGTGTGTVTSDTGLISCSPFCSDEYEAGTKVTLTATPSPGSVFYSWKYCDAGGVNGRQCTVSVDKAKTVKATFTTTHDLEVSKAPGSGPGKVQSSPGGVLCLFNCQETAAAFREGTEVVLKPTPAKHFHFVGWSGDCSGSGTCKVTMGEDHEVSAEFAEDAKHMLTLSKSGGGAGTLKSSVAGINCGVTCSQTSAAYYQGEVVELTATPGKGSAFAGWSGGGCSGTGTCTVTVDEAKEVTGEFK